MKPQSLLIIGAVGLGAYFLLSKRSVPPGTQIMLPGGGAITLTSPYGGTGAFADPGMNPTNATGLYGLGNRKRATIQPGVVPVRGNRTGQRKVGWA